MRALVVEDERKLAAFVKKGLKENAFSVDVAYNGEDGLHLARTEPYDIIILDLMLPRMDGLEVLRNLRRNNVRSPVIILTARGLVADRVSGLDAGADDYMVKPFSFAELLARVRAVLRRGDDLKPRVMNVADLSLDPRMRRVARGDTQIELTPKEYALLEYLMSHAGEIVTRTMISEHVWDYNFETFTNVIDVHINRLRAKVDRSFEPKLIHTVRGVGYVLEEKA